METVNSFLAYELFHYKEHSLTIFELVSVLTIFIITKIILWLIRKALFHKTNLNKLDKGSSFALFHRKLFFRL